MPRAARVQPFPARISLEETARRREIVRRADHENLLEGIERAADTDHIFEAFIQGEIEVTEIVPRLEQFRTAAQR